MASKSDIIDLIEAAEEVGAVYLGRTAKGHHRLGWRDRVIILPSTPSCSRSVRNSRSMLRRMGVPIRR